MRAFVMEGIGRVAVKEKPVPEPGPNDAVVRTTSALICTSDCHTVRGAIGDRHDLTLGHESVGVVHRLGSAVTGFREGQRVAVNAITPCYVCENCLRGFPSQCTQPLGGTVAVFGGGPVGLMAIQGAKLLGAGDVIAVETVPARQALARRFGADAIVDFAKVDAVAEIRKRTGGVGVDAAIEALGAEETFMNCVRVTRPGGTISNVGYHGSGDYVRIPRLDWGVGMNDTTIRTGLCPGGRERMGRLLRFLETGRVDPTPMTTHRFRFADIETAFRMMDRKEDGIVKPLIEFSR